MVTKMCLNKYARFSLMPWSDFITAVMKSTERELDVSKSKASLDLKAGAKSQASVANMDCTDNICRVNDVCHNVRVLQ